MSDLFGGEMGDQVAEVFEFWKGLHSNGRARLDADRSKAIGAMLSIGYSVEDLKLAALGCKLSAFHQGQNDRNTRYTSVRIIFQNADKVDTFIELAEREAEKMLKASADRAAKPSTEGQPRTPIPEAIRAKIETLLGRFKKSTA